MNNQTVELAELQLRRTMSQYTASHNSAAASPAGARATAAEAALLRLTSGLADVGAKYGTVSRGGRGRGDRWAGDELGAWLLPWCRTRSSTVLVLGG